jgi:hypothetical protein
MMRTFATILIPARNASATIERAVRSAMIQDDCAVILVDDFSEDDTVTCARSIGGDRVRVVRPSNHTSLGCTRQAGLDAISTPFGIWLDADDELLPGRVERLVAVLGRDDADLASDTIELFDGPSSEFLTRLTIPEFLKGRKPLARLFERNYLQGVGCHGFRTEFSRRIAFDPNLHGAEDMDFMLRAVAAGARFCLIDEPGYRLFAYPSSLSRRRENQLDMYRACLMKHEYDSVRSLFQKAGHDARITSWGLASMALFRREFERALEFVSLAESMVVDADEVLEPSGPCPMLEGWRVAFSRGSALSMMELWPEAEACFERAESIHGTAEGANNLGVAKARRGDADAAERLCTKSLERFLNYADALANRKAVRPSRTTLHPLRREPTRQDY